MKAAEPNRVMDVACLTPGLYWIMQRSEKKGVEHHGILDVGDRLARAGLPRMHAASVVHQTPPVVRRELFHGTGHWKVISIVQDEKGALERLAEACRNPKYCLVSNNCEHFVRYIVTAKRESTQIQRVAFISLLVTFGLVIARA